MLLDKARGTIDVNQATTDNGCTPLLMACHNGHAKVVSVLLARPDVDVSLAVTLPSGTQLTPLSLATARGHTDIVQLLQTRLSADQHSRTT